MRKTALIVAALLMLVCGTARADKESPKLAKYKPAVDRAIDKALRWLARNQRPNGSYPGQHGSTNAIPALAGMAFLSKGYMPGQEPHGETLNRCLDYVLATPGESGYLGVRGGRMYGQGIATLFLSEASGMVDPARQKKIDAILPKALKVILTAQGIPKDGNSTGGWRYEPNNRDSDLSISGWNLMALRSARLNGAPVPVEAIKKAIGYVNRCRQASSGGFGYQPGSATPPMTAVGLLCRELSGHHNDEVNRKAGDYLLRSAAGNALFTSGHAEYGTYYCSQAMFQLGGSYWERFAESMYNYLLGRQATDGAWRTGQGAAYPTAMYVLSLGVTYRQLPIYQR